MSHSVDIECGLHDQEGIIRGLMRMGFTRNMIEVHEKPVLLDRYVGDTIERKAHIVIRKENLSRVLGGSAYNDLGFTKNGEGYKAVVEQTYGFQAHHLSKLVVLHNVEVAKMALDAEGTPYKEEIDNRGRIQLRATFKAKTRNTIKLGG